MSGSMRDLLVAQLARLRLACEAFGIEPEDVQLDDLVEDERERLVGLAAIDLVEALGARRTAAKRPAVDDAAYDALAARRTRFRALAADRRAAAWKRAARSDAVDAASPQAVPRSTKRDCSDQGEGGEATRCDVQSRQHKIA